MKLRCPDCRETFAWNTKKAWPKFCPECGSDINNDRPDYDIPKPFISRSHKGSTFSDQVYSEMERASEARAEMAGEMAGTSASDMSGLKITNIKSNTREGEAHYIPVNNVVSQAMQAAPQMTGFQGSNGVEYGSAVQTGPHPNAGAHMRTFMQAHHRDMVAAHCVGRDEKGLPAMPNLNVTSDLPARETLQPGYRRRG